MRSAKFASYSISADRENKEWKTWTRTYEENSLTFTSEKSIECTIGILLLLWSHVYSLRFVAQPRYENSCDEILFFVFFPDQSIMTTTTQRTS